MASHSVEEIYAAIQEAVSQLDYKELHVKQEEPIEHFFLGNGVFVSLPTGSGRSVTDHLGQGVVVAL